MPAGATAGKLEWSAGTAGLESAVDPKWRDQFDYPHGPLPVVMAAGFAVAKPAQGEVKNARHAAVRQSYLMVMVIFCETTGGLNG